MKKRPSLDRSTSCTKVPSILMISIGKSRRLRKEVWPAPKSSIAISMPSAFTAARTCLVRCKSASATDSVISTMSRPARAPPFDACARSVSSHSGSASEIAEALMASLSPGGGALLGGELDDAPVEQRDEAVLLARRDEEGGRKKRPERFASAAVLRGRRACGNRLEHGLKASTRRRSFKAFKISACQSTTRPRAGVPAARDAPPPRRPAGQVCDRALAITEAASISAFA